MLNQSLISNNYPAKETSYKMANAKAEAIPRSQSWHECISFQEFDFTEYHLQSTSSPQLSKVASLIKA